MNDTKDIILKLKDIREEKGLSLNDIVNLIEKNGDIVSRSSVQRVFADGSEDVSFRYEETIRPIAKALLDIETIEADDNMDIQAMKMLLKYKIQKIEELESQISQLESDLNKEKLKSHEKLEKERERANRSIDFLKDQVALKDKRMDILLESVQKKDARFDELMDRLIKCQCCVHNKGDQNETI